MKKILLLICSLLLVITLLCGCGAKSVDLNQIMDYINTEYNITNVTKIDDVTKLKRYYEIEKEDVKQFAAEYASDAKVYCEVVLVEAVDSNAADRIITSLQNHLDAKISEGRSYSPEDVAMLESCEVYKNGNYIALIIGADAQDIEDYFISQLA